jgi:predicted Zn finger-like uncharacterized protein
MYTRCPHCQTAIRIDLKRLRAAGGEVLCRHCHVAFNALFALSGTTGEPSRDAEDRHGDANSAPVPSETSAGARPAREDALPSFSARAGRFGKWQPIQFDEREEGSDQDTSLRPRASLWSRLGWIVGTVLLAVLLVGQGILFEGPKLARQETLRPWLDGFCRIVGCVLPSFRKVERIRVIDRNLHAAPDDIDGFEFSLIMTNQAALPQVYPDIRLVLTEVNGNPVAARVFKPREYLATDRPGTMPVGQPVEIRLLLAKPSREIGGFVFDLL